MKLRHIICEMENSNNENVRRIKPFTIVITAIVILFILSFLIFALIMKIESIKNEGIFDETSNIQTGVEDALSDSVTDKIDGDDGVLSEPDIYSGAWKQLNAVIVEWGAKTTDSWSESISYRNNNDEIVPYRVNYAGVKIKIIEVFDMTMTDSIKASVDDSVFLLIPEHYLEYVTEGERSLVFLESIYRKTSASNDGNAHATKQYLGVTSGDIIDTVNITFNPPPMFSISNDTLIVPESAYSMDISNHEYQTSVMNPIEEANHYILNSGASNVPIFADKMKVDELCSYFEHICSLK